MMWAVGQVHVFDRRVYLIFHVILIISVHGRDLTLHCVIMIVRGIGHHLETAMQCSRRRFVEFALTGLPAVAAFGGGAVERSSASAASVGEAATGAVRLGVQTYSFRDMLGTPGDMTDKMIAAMRELGLTECEVFEPTLQPPILSADAPWRMTGGSPPPASFFGR